MITSTAEVITAKNTSKHVTIYRKLLERTVADKRDRQNERYKRMTDQPVSLKPRPKKLRIYHHKSE